MDLATRFAVKRQFEASLDMLENAIRACPDDLWLEPTWLDDGAPSPYSVVWYVAYHALFWLDLYLTGEVDGFAPPAPFTLSELDAEGFPPTHYTSGELLAYLAYCRSKLRDVFDGLTPERAIRPCRFPWGEPSYAELLLYNMRHVQEHASQLNLFLGQHVLRPPGWVTGVPRPVR